ncbi:MAG TPA: acyltransferase family protein [Candidatus Binatia bacterium]|nr:acyltransferase family protein [Candidatus Binatia bacterium]
MLKAQKDTTDQTQKMSPSRLVSMDFVRVLALLGVILFHASGAYANIPYWSVQNGTSSVAIGIRELVDVFIMPLFFFLAGYFTLGSLRKKGSWGFIKSKFWELGFAWIVIVILVIPFSWWIVNHQTTTGSYLTTWFTWIQSAGQTRLGVFETPAQSVHLHFWFISLLFAFFIAFLLIYKVSGNYAAKHFITAETSTSAKKTSLALLAFGVSCVVGYFISLLLVPDQSWLTINLFLEFQPSKLFIFAACFAFGIYAYSKNWFADGKQIGKLSMWIAATILLSVAFLLVGRDEFQNSLATPLSYVYLLLYAALRSFLLLSVMLTVCSLGVRYFNRPSRTISSLASNSYNIYLLHLFFASTFQDILMIWSGPIVIKIAMVFGISLLISYSVSRWIFKKTGRWKGLIILAIISFVLPLAATLL